MAEDEGFRKKLLKQMSREKLLNLYTMMHPREGDSKYDGRGKQLSRADTNSRISIGSLMDNDENKDEDSSTLCTGIVDPFNPFKLYLWDTTVCMFIIYTVIMGPYEAAFVSTSEASYTALLRMMYAAMIFLSDFIFIVDMFVITRTKIVIKRNGIDFLVEDSKAILYKYLTGDFLIDLISIGIPFNLDSLLISYIEDENSRNVWTRVINLLNLVKVFRLKRLNTLIFRIFQFKATTIKWFAIAFMIIGALMCAVIMGSVVAILDSAGVDQQRALTEKLVKISDWTKVHRVSTRATSLAMRATKLYHEVQDSLNSAIRALPPMALRSTRRLAYGRVLRSCYVFAGLDECAIQELAQGLEMEVCVAGVVVIEANEVGSSAFIVQKGACGVMGFGGVAIVRTLTQGEVFGVLPAMVPGIRASNTIKCLTDCIFYTLSKTFLENVGRHRLCDLSPVAEIALEDEMQRHMNLTERADRIGVARALSKEESPLATLIITIRAAKNVAPADFDGNSDPYCEVVIEDQNSSGSTAQRTPLAQFKTEVIFDTRNPLWNEVFVFSQIDEDLLRKQTISFVILDHDVIGFDTVLAKFV
eukprot:g47.t1